MAATETQPAAQTATPPAAPAPAAKAPAATIAELKAAFPGREGFVLECVEKGLTVLEAKAAFADVLATELSARDRRIGELQQQVKAAKPPAAGAQPAPLPGAQTAAGEPSDEDITSGKLTQEQFDANEDIKRAFMGSYANYQAYAKAAKGGRISIKTVPTARA